MEIVTPAAWRQRAFPDPIDVNAGNAGEDEQDQNNKEALQSGECKGRGGGVSNDEGRKKTPNAEHPILNAERSEDGSRIRLRQGSGATWVGLPALALAQAGGNRVSL